MIVIRAFFLAVLSLAMVVPVARAGQATEVFDIRFGRDAQGQTRVVLDMDGDAPYRAYTRMGPEGKRMLALEIRDARFNIGGAPVQSGMGEGLGLLPSYAFAANDQNRAQILFNMAEPAVPVAVFMIEPKGKTSKYRLVIDMAAASDSAFRDSLGKGYGPLSKTDMADADVVDLTDGRQAPYAVSAQQTRAAAIAAAEKAAEREMQQRAASALTLASISPRVKPRSDKTIIVLDPGHGGTDPGAVGTAGTYEKTVTFAAARQLKTLLEARGYTVILTRDKDTYIELEDRMKKARKAQADLFLSLHADALDNPDVRGASVYTLSDKGETRLAREAAARGDFQVHGINDVEDETDAFILFDMAKGQSLRESSKFANLLIERLKTQVPIVNNTHRHGNFKVLLAPDVPAVLVELGFMSNAEDEKNLGSAKWRKKTVTAIANGIDAYFAQRAPIRHAQAEAAGGAQ